MVLTFMDCLGKTLVRLMTTIATRGSLWGARGSRRACSRSFHSYQRMVYGAWGDTGWRSSGSYMAMHDDCFSPYRGS